MVLWVVTGDAVLQMGGSPWVLWNRGMKETLIPLQRSGRAEVGSWDPIGPLASAGGRVAATALAVLSLESYCRYARAAALR